MRLCRRTFAVLAVLLLAGAGGAAAADLAALRERALELVNRDRAAEGLPPLAAGEALNEAAQRHAEDMLGRGYYSHVSPDGRNPLDRYLAAGGGRSHVVGENIARCRGCQPPATVERIERLQRGWMDSPEHRRNILARGFTRFGFGIVVEAGKPLYAVQTFAGAGATAGEPLPAGEQTARAADAINEARRRRDAPPLEASEALAAAARTLARGMAPGAAAPSEAELAAALPPDWRTRWRSLALLAGTCSGCGSEPVAADIERFREQWLGDARYRDALLDPAASHVGLALEADGQGRKTAIALVARRR